MKRFLTALATTATLWGCVEASNPRRCDGKADFELTLSSPTGGFPSDTQIEVTFGGGSTETYWLSASNDPEVLFCETTPALGSQAGEGGAGGSNTPDAGAAGSAWTGGKGHGGVPPTGTNGSAIRAITCEIWSAGPATIMIRAGAWDTERELKPDPEICIETRAA